MRAGLRIVAAITMLALVAPLAAQLPDSRTFSRPALPRDEVLRRLDLRLAWRQSVPMDGRKDALLRVLIDGRDLLVLTRSGMVARLDAETGRIYWKSRAGRPYTAAPVIAANNRSVFAVMNAEALSIDRERGELEWKFDLPAGISTAPVADDDLYYLPGSDNRITAFALPPPEEFLAGLSPAVRRERSTPREAWTQYTNLELAFQPLRTPTMLFCISPEGKARAYSAAKGGESFRFTAGGKIRAKPGQFGDSVYVGADDGDVTALSLTTGKQLWRYTAGSAILRTPAAIDTDLFVTSEREGMARLDRETGDSKWKVPLGRGRVSTTNPDADMFLAASERFVYALDASKRLLVIDRKRGVTLSMVNWVGYRHHIVNVVTDRLYLAANDGTIICLHDRALPKAVRYRLQVENAEAPIHRKLDEPVSDDSARPGRLEDLLKDLGKKYRFRFEFDTIRLKAAGLEGVADKEVKMPRVDERPLRELLEKLLNAAGAAFDVAGGNIRIIPPVEKGREKEKEKEKDKGKEKEKEKEKDAAPPKGKDKEKDKGKEKDKDD
jgi:outer membrane protein assembly factor BamB